MTHEFLEHDEGRLMVRLEGELSIYRAGELKQLLLDALYACDDLQLDLGGITEIDSAGVQLLLLIKNEAMRCGKSFSMNRHSPAVIELLELYNLSPWFGDVVVIPAREVRAS